MAEIHGYNKRYLIPNYQDTGKVQMFVYSEELGMWFDAIATDTEGHPVWRLQSWIDENIAPNHKLAPSPRKMMDQTMEENDEQVK